MFATGANSGATAIGRCWPCRLAAFVRVPIGHGSKARLSVPEGATTTAAIAPVVPVRFFATTLLSSRATALAVVGRATWSPLPPAKKSPTIRKRPVWGPGDGFRQRQNHQQERAR